MEDLTALSFGRVVAPTHYLIMEKIQLEIQLMAMCVI